MEIRQYFSIVIRWLWLIILGVLIGGGISYSMSVREAKTYQASTRVQVMSAPQSINNPYSFYNDQQLAKTYVQTIKTRPILDAVEEKVGKKLNGGQVTATAVAETQLIDITIEYGNPDDAAEIANILVKVFVEKNTEMQAGRFLESEQSLQSQLAQVDAQIQALQMQSKEVYAAATEATLAKTKNEINRLEGEILTLQAEIEGLASLPPAKVGSPAPTLPPAEKLRLNEKEMRLKLLQNTYNLYQQIYINLLVAGKSNDAAIVNADNKNQSTMALYEQIRASLLSSYEEVRLARLNSTSNIVQIEPAVPNNRPIRPQTTRDTALGAAIGLVVAGLIIFLIEYLDDTLKTAEQITRILELPVIGYIADIKNKTDMPYVLENPRSPVSESFRTLRTNLEFAGVDKPLHTLLVVSANPSEGKTTVASNLAISFMQGGKYVLLIDADLRRPRIHKYFDLPNRVGLSNIFRESIPLNLIVNKWKDTKLSIITSGNIPPNPADLISSKKMVSVLEAGKNAADIVIVDAPPFLVADASILASYMDGVLLVIHPGKTPIDAAVTTLEQMKRAGANVVGVVMNRIPKSRSYYYGGYRYYSPYYQSQYQEDENGKPPKSNGRGDSWLGRLLKRKKDPSEDIQA